CIAGMVDATATADMNVSASQSDQEYLCLNRDEYVGGWDAREVCPEYLAGFTSDPCECHNLDYPPAQEQLVAMEDELVAMEDELLAMEDELLVAYEPPGLDPGSIHPGTVDPNLDDDDGNDDDEGDNNRLGLFKGWKKEPI